MHVRVCIACGSFSAVVVVLFSVLCMLRVWCFCLKVCGSPAPPCSVYKNKCASSVLLTMFVVVITVVVAFELL